MSPLFCLLTLVFTMFVAAGTAKADWLNMPERAASARDIAAAFDAAGPAVGHSEKLLQDGSRRYIFVLWKNPYSCSTNDVVYAYYFDGADWVKFYQDRAPMWKGEPHIERRARVLGLAEDGVLLLGNDSRFVSLGGVPRVRTMPTE